MLTTSVFVGRWGCMARRTLLCLIVHRWSRRVMLRQHLLTLPGRAGLSQRERGRLQYRLSTAVSWTTSEAATTLESKKITGLESGKIYNFRVRRGTGPYGTANASTTHIAPTLTVGTRTTTSVALTWTAGTVENGTYQIQYKLTTETQWTTDANAFTGQSKTVTGLRSGLQYDFRIRRGTGPYGTARGATRHTAPVITVQSILGTTVTLTWTSGSVTTGTYRLEYKKTGRYTMDGF